MRKLVPQLPIHGGYIILFAGKLAAVQGRIAGQVALAVEHYVLAQLAYLSTQQGGGILQRDQLQLQGKVQLFLLQTFFQGGKIPKMKVQRNGRVLLLEQQQLFQNGQVFHAAHHADLKRGAALGSSGAGAAGGIFRKVGDAHRILVEYLPGTGKRHRVPCALEQLGFKFFF